MKSKLIFRILTTAIILSLPMLILPASPALSAVGVIYLSPTYGAPGSTAYVVGSSFTTDNTAFAYFQGSLVNSSLVVSGGTFIIPFTVPTVPRGSSYPVTISSAGDTSNTALFTVTPEITTVTPTSGYAGDQATVSGNGFQAGASVNILFDDAVVATTTASATGIISNAPFTVPQSEWGPHTIKGNDGIGDSAGVTFSVDSKIILTPEAGGSSDIVTVSGTGFTADSDVTVEYDGVVVPTSPASVTTNDTTGSFAATFTVPTGTRGSYTVRAQDASGKVATATFTIGERITITPTSGFVGDQVAVSGTGFTGGSGVTITLNDTSVGSITHILGPTTTDPSGTFTDATFTIPALTKGVYIVKARDASNYEATATFTIGEKIAITPDSGVVGDTFTVSGSGFGANKSIDFYLDDVLPEPFVAVATSDPNGSFTDATFYAPSVSKGSHTIKAQDSAGNFASATFTIDEKITITPTSAFSGDVITVNGSGFGANKSIDFYLDDVLLSAAAATSDPNGSFTGALDNEVIISDNPLGNTTILALPSGSHTIKAQDSAGNFASATFTIDEKIAITPDSGVVGDTVTISGSGFGADRRIDLYIDGVAVSAGAATSDPNGGFSGSLTIPVFSGGSHTLEARDSVGNSATATLDVGPKMTISPTSGDARTEVTVGGTGFGASQSVTIKYNGEVVATNPAAISTNSSGSFGTSFNPLAIPEGTYTVEVSDGTLSVSADFVAVANITISQATTEVSPGWVGMELTINGAGFKPNITVTVTYETEPVVLATTTTDSAGSFSVAFTIPESAGGAHIITATDGETTKQFTFVLDSQPPLPPQPLLPTMGFKAKQPVQFDWQEVTDPSPPLTYTLQIARDEAFATLVLEKTGLTEPGYTLTEAEKLESVTKDEPYYWRVRVIDGASNESPWTGVGTFIVGFVWPDWIVYLWFGLGILAAGILGFWLGMRTAYSSF